MGRRWIVATCLLAMGHCATLSAKPLYDLLRLDGHYVKWGKPELGTGAVVTYRLADTRLAFDKATNCRMIDPLHLALQRSGIDLQRADSEIRQAFAAWEAVADIRFRPAESGETADIIIGAQAIPRGRAFTNVAYAGDGRKSSGADRGLTSLTPQNAAVPAPKGRSVPPLSIAQSLICLNPQTPWKTGFGSDPEAYDLRYTLIHEIGHSIGLDHAGRRGQVMSFDYGEDFRAPRAGDIAGAVRLYGAARGD